MCWLAVVEAEVHARIGNTTDCEIAIKKAKDVLKDKPLGVDRYATGFNPSRLAGYEGACFLWLHQPKRALPALQQALSLLDPQAIRRKSTLFTDIGIAYAQQGDVQSACQMATQALALTKQTKSLYVLERVHIILDLLKDQQKGQEVAVLEFMLNHTATLIFA